MISERVEQEEEGTKNFYYKLLNLLNMDLEEKDCHDIELIARTIVYDCDDCAWGEGYEIASKIITGITGKNLETYMDEVVMGDQCGFVWETMNNALLERAKILGIVKEENKYNIRKIDDAVNAFCMDTDAWLDASDEDFTNDMRGILENIDDSECGMRFYDYRKFNGFIPKFSRLDEIKYYTIELTFREREEIVFVFVPNGTVELALKKALIGHTIYQEDMKDVHCVKEHNLEEIRNIYETTKLAIREC